jgi:hypothetical protein
LRRPPNSQPRSPLCGLRTTVACENQSEANLHRRRQASRHLSPCHPSPHPPSISNGRHHLNTRAKFVGDAAATVTIILHSRPHPEQGFRSCIGILRLATRYDAERLDGACARALALGTRSYSSVATILKNAQDRKPHEPEQPSLFHENIRGPGYYH